MIANVISILTVSGGVAVPKYKPQTAFIGTPTTLSQNNEVDFTDQSTVDPLGPPITGWAWTFEGGTPGTSSDQNPQNILYPTPGNYDVTLVATNADGSTPLTKTDYITVEVYTPPFVINDWQIGNYYVNLGQPVDGDVVNYGIKL